MNTLVIQIRSGFALDPGSAKRKGRSKKKGQDREFPHDSSPTSERSSARYEAYEEKFRDAITWKTLLLSISNQNHVRIGVPAYQRQLLSVE